MSTDTEYSERPVPRDARLGFAKPAFVWGSFAYAYICIFIGSQIMAGLGAPVGYLAIIAGQAFLFVYAGLIGHKSFQYGFNFPLMVKSVFGRLGYAPMTLLVAVLVNGWFVFQAWLAADLQVGLYGGESFSAGAGSGILPGILGTTAFWAAVWAIVFGLIAVHGIRTMAWMGRAAIVLVTGLAGYIIYAILTQIHAGENPFESSIVGEPWTFGVGVTASIGTFIVSATMTGDFSRWTKSVRQAWGVNAVAFPTCNQLMLFVGAIFTAVALKLDFYFGMAGIAGGSIIMIIQWVSNGTTCDGCLYNCTQSYKNVIYNLKRGKSSVSWKKAATVAMIAGAAVGASNLMQHIVPWLLLLGIVVPTVGGPIIGHFWIVARKDKLEQHLRAAEKKVNKPAIAGFLVGLGLAIAINQWLPDIPVLLGGMVGGVVVYPIVAYVTGYARGGRLLPKAYGEDTTGGMESMGNNTRPGGTTPGITTTSKPNATQTSDSPNATQTSDSTSERYDTHHKTDDPVWINKLETTLAEVFPWLDTKPAYLRLKSK